MPKPVMIDLDEVAQDPERSKIKYGNYDVVEKMYSIKKNTLKKWTEEMRGHPEFKKGIYNPTHKIVLIHLDTFEEFFKWKEANRYKA